ncbi:hypothetical protein AB6A40_005121 [Gnathostoma spinigerum]|uniref:Uncharacterized protein n=1 Tax=Gnathostoma spinigerum TaxID=75299 RepID=A0ABD6EPC9_9BILA
MESNERQEVQISIPFYMRWVARTYEVADAERGKYVSLFEEKTDVGRQFKLTLKSAGEPRRFLSSDFRGALNSQAVRLCKRP